MAGIGFELKKIYKKEGISRALMGAFYSTAVTVGPTILVIGTILVLYLILDITEISIADRELLSSTILYIFIFSCSLVAPFNAVLSRYLADKFYGEEDDNILPSYYSGLLIVIIISAIMSAPVMWSMYYRGGVDLPFIMGAYVLWVSSVILFFSITYLHGTKDYKIIAFFFGSAMIITIFTSAALHYLIKVDQTHSILYGLATGFFMIAFSEFAYIRHYFKKHGKNYIESLGYIKKYWKIFCANLFYITGMYVHNFVMWSTSERITVANTFVSHQAYDMASCLAMFSNISVTVIFTVLAETEFHDSYQKYMEAVIGGTYKLIQKNKRIMFNTLSLQLGNIFSLQIAITTIVFLALEIFAIPFGFSSVTMAIYPILTIAYLGVFMMYSMIVYLYYFEDTTGAMLTSLIFMTGTFVCMLFSKEFRCMFYGVGLLAGMLMGFSFAFFRLRRMERVFEKHIFCRYKLIETNRTNKNSVTIYKKGL